MRICGWGGLENGELGESSTRLLIQVILRANGLLEYFHNSNFFKGLKYEFGKGLS